MTDDVAEGANDVHSPRVTATDVICAKPNGASQQYRNKA